MGLGVGGRRAFGRLVFRQCTKIWFGPPTWWNIRPLLSSCRVLGPWDGGAEAGKAPQTLCSRSSGSSEGEGQHNDISMVRSLQRMGTSPRRVRG